MHPSISTHPLFFDIYSFSMKKVKQISCISFHASLSPYSFNKKVMSPLILYFYKFVYYLCSVNILHLYLHSTFLCICNNYSPNTYHCYYDNGAIQYVIFPRKKVLYFIFHSFNRKYKILVSILPIRYTVS